MASTRSGEVGIRGAALIQFASKYSTIFVSLIVTAVLARLLTPADFGVVAIVTVFTSLFSVFSDMGIGTAIVQFRELTTRQHEQIFTFSLLLALGLALILGVAAWPIALFYGNDQLVPLVWAVTPSLFFSTLNMVPNGLMLRNKAFKSIGVRVVVTAVVAGAVAIVAAFAGLGPYALVLQTDLQAIFVFFWNFLRSPLRRLDVHFMEPLRLIFGYSAFQFGFTFVNYFARNLDNLLIGKFFGDAQLGYYDKAYKLTTYPLTAFSGVIAGVVQPYMAEHQSEPQMIFAFWRKIQKFISLVGAGLTAGLMACSSEVILLFYGDQWSASIPLFTVLAFSIYTQMLGSSAGAFFQSLGRTDLMFRCGLCTTGLTVVMLFAGIATGSLDIVAGCIAIAYVLQIFVNFWFLIHCGFQESLKVLKMFLPEICIAAIAVIVCSLLSPILNVWGLLASFAVKCVVVLAIMLGGYALTHQLQYVKAVLKRG